MIENYEIDKDRPTIDDYGVPIDYNCHACDASLSWVFGDWHCLSCQRLGYDDEDEDGVDSYEDFHHDWTTACFDVDAHE